MIIVDDREWLTFITQPDHARFAAELLSLWRTDDLPEHPRRQDLLFATREHDNGWQEVDSAPWVDTEVRRPYDFRTFPEASRFEIWQKGILRFANQRPFVALLIAEHAESIHRPLSEDWIRFFEKLEPLRQKWFEQAGIDRTAVRQDYAYLELADTLSLALCASRRGHLECQGVTASIEGKLMRLDPFPLAGTTSFKIPIRKIANRPYDSDVQVGTALARAPWQHLQVQVGPYPPPNA